jgi:hypothetical protein
MGLWGILLNIALFALASPVVIILTALNILYAAFAPFPITVKNLGLHVKKFEEASR